MKKKRSAILYLFLTVFILAGSYGVSLIVQQIFGTDALIPGIFILGVFLISVVTPGYSYGIGASLASVLLINHSFMFPYLKFNFSISENLISAIIILILTIMTSTLTTKVKQIEKIRLESETEKMRANLLRAISHDLRTPLTTIYGSSSAMISGYDRLSREQMIQLARGIKEDSEWLIRMVENLLTVTRIDNAEVRLIKTPVVLEELIDAALIRFKKRYPQQPVTVEIPEEFISIPMDAVLIEQVIVNLLENAVQHAKGMTKLTLRVHTQEEIAVFEISDDGCGIARDRLAHIFSGSLRADGENKNMPVDNYRRSMGIGLSVCASIVKAHDGEIRVRNNKAGGCTFQFTLAMENGEDEQQI